LNSLEFVCDILRCATENRIAIVETGADESMSNKRCSVSVKTVSDVPGVLLSYSSMIGRNFKNKL